MRVTLGSRRRLLRPVALLAGAFVAVALVAGPTTPADAATTLAKPTAVKVSTGTHTATVTWTAAQGATSYALCLKTSATATTCGHHVTTTANTFTFTGLQPTGGTDYYVRVSAHAGSKTASAALVPFDLATPTPPSVPSSVKATATASTVTVTWTASTHAVGYEVCLLADGTTSTCSQRSARSTATSHTFTGLAPTSGTDWYYFVRAYGTTGNGYSTSAKGHVDLPVGAPGTTTIGTLTTTSVPLTWPAITNAGTYRVQLSTTAAFTTLAADVVTTTPSTTVTGLTPGTGYYVRVRGENDAVVGAYSALKHATLGTTAISVPVVTYNLCGQDKCLPSEPLMTPWTKRKTAAGYLARISAPDILATQESGDKDTNFITQLPGFKRAEYKSAKSLFYRTSRFTLLRSGWITLDSTRKRYAVWAELMDRSTHTPVFAVDAHLEPYKGKTLDDLRYAQTKKLISGVDTANVHHLPVIWAGDFNSNKNNAEYSGGYDAPKKAFTAIGVEDSEDVAASRTNLAYNSVNQAKNPPIKNGDHVDHVYVDPSITVKAYNIYFRLDSDGDYLLPFPSDHNPVKVLLSVPGKAATHD